MNKPIMINGITYYDGKGYPNPYYRTDTGIYNVAEEQFKDSIQREGVIVTDYWTDEQYLCFFRRNKDTNQTNNNVTIFYPANNGIVPGSIIKHYGQVFLVLNQETVENRVYNRSDGINADVLISSYDPDTGTEVSVPCFAYDLTGSLWHTSDMMTTTAGNTEFITGDNERSRRLKINMEFWATGNYYKIVNVNYKTGICRIEASIIQKHDEPVYAMTIKTDETYKPGDAVKLVAEPTINGGPVANPTLVWSSSDPSIATIDELGNALFVSEGTCAISCYWKEHDVIATVHIIVVNTPATLECKIEGEDSMFISTDTTYTAKFYAKDGTEDASISPLWSLDIPASIAKSVKIKSQSGKTVTLYANSGTQGNDIGLVLTDAGGVYNATKTIRITSWL